MPIEMVTVQFLLLFFKLSCFKVCRTEAEFPLCTATRGGTGMLSPLLMAKLFQKFLWSIVNIKLKSKLEYLSTFLLPVYSCITNCE